MTCVGFKKMPILRVLQVRPGSEHAQRLPHLTLLPPQVAPSRGVDAEAPPPAQNAGA